MHCVQRSHGVHTQIWQKVSIMEMGKLLPQVLRHFDLEWASDKPEWDTRCYGVHKQMGMIVKFKPKNRPALLLLDVRRPRQRALQEVILEVDVVVVDHILQDIVCVGGDECEKRWTEVTTLFPSLFRTRIPPGHLDRTSHASICNLMSTMFQLCHVLRPRRWNGKLATSVGEP